jgi:hypothetical protein
LKLPQGEGVGWFFAKNSTQTALNKADIFFQHAILGAVWVRFGCGLGASFDVSLNAHAGAG